MRKMSVWKRVLTFLLAFVLVLPPVPAGYAATEETTPEETAAWEETCQPATTEDTVPTETVWAAETVESTVPVETLELAEPTETIETVPEDIPVFVLTQAQREEKRQLAELAASLTDRVPDVDYAEGEILVRAVAEDEALWAAEVFDGILESFRSGIALIRLEGTTVLEAVTAAADPESALPAAYPNDIYVVEPVLSAGQSAAAMGISLPEKLDWESWVRENGIDDPYLQDPADSDYQWMHDMVNTYAAWGVTIGSPAVKVAVLDTGMQEDHPDLAGKVTSYDIGCGTTDCSGHGTHVAGILAAGLDNGAGGAGIAPNVSILNIRVFANAYGARTFDIIAGINEAVERGAWIINLSLGSYFRHPLEEEAIESAIDNGVTVIAAMGNDGSNTVHYPAAYDGVIAVSAVDAAGSRAWFSNYGSWADLAAPGADMMSTVSGGRYESWNGTSMAAPVVSGLAALYMSAQGWTAPAQMEKLLKAATVKASDSGLGKGIVDAEKLFGGNQGKPSYEIHGDAFFLDDYDGSTLSCESTLYFYCPTMDNTGVILYTTDGKTPSVRNGEVVNGKIYTGPIDLSPFAGKTVTVKAAYISGLGVVNKTVTLRLKVDRSRRADHIEINGPQTLIAGKRGTYSASVFPEFARQEVSWFIVYRSEDQKKASISKTGLLTTVSGKSGTIVLRAQSKEHPACMADFTVEVVARKPVSKLTLSASSMTLWAGDSSAVSVLSAMDTAGNPVELGRGDLLWTSSNPKVVTVDANGNVTALTRGSASITCKVLDGSNKTAQCRITVTQSVQSIVLTGQDMITPGYSATYKAQVLPTNASSKKVLWSLVDAPQGATVSASGVVKVPKGTPEGLSFTVVAEAADGSGTIGAYRVLTANRCTAISIGYSGTLGAERVTQNSKGVMTALQLYSIQRPNGIDGGDVTDTSAILEAFVSGTDYARIFWESSNPKVADLYINDLGQLVVRAVATGKAKITCTARDGSNRKASITVNVGIPVSSMSIRSDAGRILKTGNPVIAFGKSATNSVTFADTYGVPTNRKVSWSFTLGEYDKNGKLLRDWTGRAWQQSLVSISTSGRLTTKRTLADLRTDGELRITVIATALDGTGAQATLDYYAIPPTTVLTSSDRYWNIYSDNTQWGISVACDQWLLFGDEDNCAFTVTSSNPNLVSVASVECYNKREGLYRIWLASGRNGATGTARITIKSGDGSKTLTLTVWVYR